jgi:hypothetical protein
MVSSKTSQNLKRKKDYSFSVMTDGNINELNILCLFFVVSFCLDDNFLIASVFICDI